MRSFELLKKVTSFSAEQVNMLGGVHVWRRHVTCRAASLSTKSKAAAQISRVRGTRDLLADDAEQHQLVLRALQETANGYGFRPVRGVVPGASWLCVHLYLTPGVFART